MLEGIQPLTAAISGAALAGVPLGMFIIRLVRRHKVEQALRLNQAAETSKHREILDASPDGLFIWDHETGREMGSHRLAVLLELADGTDATYHDLRNAFEGDASAAFDRAVGSLRRSGTAFDQVLPVGGRLIHVIGGRVSSTMGEPLADLLWMRDVDGVPAGATAPDTGQPDALTAAYDSFQYLLDALPVPIWLRDADFAVAFTNKACGGVNLARLTGNLAGKARDGGKALIETHVLTQGDQQHPIEVTETPVKGWVGTAGFAIPGRGPVAPAGVSGEGASVPGLHLLESLGAAVAVFGADKKLEAFNRTWADLWRLDAEWLGKNPPLAEILDRMRDQRRLPEVTDFRAFKEKELALFDSGSEPVRRELHLPDGAAILSIVTQAPQGGLVFTDEDITDRLTLQRDMHTLDAVQRETLDNLHEGVAVFGSDGRLRLRNPRLLELWQLSADALPAGTHVGAFISLLKPLLPEVADWEAYRDRVAAQLTGREPASGRIARPDGSVVTYANVPLPDGAVLTGYLDVSDSAKVEAALVVRAQALDEANKLKSSFIANVSHEIRVPMNTIVGFAEILTQEYFGSLNKRQKEYGEGILDASQGLMQVVGNILDLALIEAGTMTLDVDSVDLHAGMVSVLSLVRERARRKSLILEFDCPADIGWIVADERRIRQVLLNLLSNAIQFTPVRGTVRVSADRQGEDMVLKVSDTGIGIPQGEQNRAFEAFERRPEPDTGHAGAGLGLSIVKQFIELHGGSVEIKSIPNKGTTVTCRLPVGGLIGDQEAFPTPGLPH